MMVRALDIAGQKFGRLTVTKRLANDHRGRSMWACQCECGNRSKVRGSALMEANTLSCGCIVPETMARIGRANGTHRLSRTSEYGIWNQMRYRCYNKANKKFPIYGGRGITVCARWRNSFENFLADMKMRPTSRHTIDRFPNTNGNYTPTNCRWATYSQQNRNRRPFKRRRK